MKKTKSFKCFTSSKYISYKVSTYFDIYDHLFLKFKNKNITFVEVGVFSGGSLEMWRKFFGNKARIIGIDINPIAKKWEKNGFEIFIGNQSDPNFWKNFIKEVGKIDILLDDGGHTYEQQILTTEYMLENINDGGLLVVEDTHTSYMNGFGLKQYSFIEYVKKLIDKINHRFDHFEKHQTEKRIWSIEVFESIVAFHINKASRNTSPKVVDNKGISDEAEDFRYKDNENVRYLMKVFKWLKFNKIPILKNLYISLVNFNISKGFKNQTKKFF